MALWDTNTMYHVVKHSQKIGHAQQSIATKSDAVAQNVFFTKHISEIVATNV